MPDTPAPTKAFGAKAAAAPPARPIFAVGSEAEAAHRSSYARYRVVRAIFLLADLVALIPLFAVALLPRAVPRRIDIGIGPVPTINVRYHKAALMRRGYSCESFVDALWHITEDFDITFARHFRGPLRGLVPYLLFVLCVLRYRCLYLYFTGGPLRHTTLLVRLEPLLLRLAGVRTVLMPFGMDVHELTRTKNRLFVHAMSLDYPWFRFYRRRTEVLVDQWTRYADFIVAGCDWVNYLYYWDMLTLSHFTIDTEEWQPAPAEKAAGRADAKRPLRLLHAPNHRALKGTEPLLRAVDELRAEGLEIELSVLEGVPNDQVKAAMERADIIVDQFVIGWYAMFAIEGMALGKPVICSVRPEFDELYRGAGILGEGELPLIACDIFSIKQTLRDLNGRRSEFAEIGRRGRAFVEKFHSLDAMGSVFDQINRRIGLSPRRAV